MPNTYITVPFQQKDQAKELGAKWDSAQRQWYVPSGLDLAAFARWLPAAASVDSPAVSSRDLALSDENPPAPVGETAGVSLSQLLAGVERAVSQAFREGVWTRVDVVSVSAKNGHVYLEVSERNEEGVTVAQARAAIWARTAARILPDFQRATGAELAPGIKLLVRARPVFKAQYGFSLEVTEIDASYTVGDLEAQKRRIRERLQQEGLFDRNKRLPAPWDFTRLLVVSPQGAAALGDFAAEADRLHELRVCEFIYVHSRFQGTGAPAEILAAAQAGLENAGAQLDALIIIRGGGAVNELAWLNDYDLARFVCMCSVPVLTGIGHERDSTVLDEVAHRSFDTPSKVIGAIERQIALRARDAKTAYNDVLVQANRFVERASIAAERLDSEIRAAARATLASARSQTDSGINRVRLASHAQVHEARHEVQLASRDVQDGARQHLAQAKTRVPSAMSSVNELARAALRQVRGNVHALLPAVLEQAGTNLQLARRHLLTSREALFERAQQSVRAAKTGADGLVREITGQGPKKTLARGFAVARASNGKTVTSAAAARDAGSVALTFNDGTVKATVRAKHEEGAKDGK